MADYFVTGVSGALGSRVIPLLGALAETSKIVGIDRRRLPASAPKLRYLNQQLEDCDLSSLLVGTDVVLHFATTTEIGPLRELLNAATKAHVKHIVIASSATVYGAWPTNAIPIDEQAPLRPNPGFDYAVRLAEAERVVGEWQRQHPSIHVSILRMAMVLGGGLDRALTRTLGGVETFREIDSVRQVQFLHVDDAVSAIMFVLTNRVSGTFNVAPKDSIGEETARAVAGVAPRPGLPRRLAGIANDWLFRGRYRSSFKAAAPYLRYSWVISSQRLQDRGWCPTHTSEEALVREAKPTWWAGLRPGQRRSIVNAGVMAGGAVSAVVSLVVGVRVIPRRHRHDNR